MRLIVGALLGLLFVGFGFAGCGAGLVGIAVSDGPGLVTAKVLVAAGAVLTGAGAVLVLRTIRGLPIR